MNVRLLGATALMACALASCSTIKSLEAGASALAGTTVSAKSVVIAINAANAVEGTATNYKNAPLCTSGQTFLKNGCSNQTVINALTPAVNTLVSAKKALLAAGTSATPGQLSALNAAKAVLQGVLSNGGIS